MKTNAVRRAVSSRSPIRILTAVPICDGHDSAIVTINLELIRHGIEVIYLGYHRSVQDIVRAAIQEDVRAIGLSSYNGGHVEFFSEVLSLLRRRGAKIGLFGGGGGTITASDARLMKRRGVDEIFFAGTPLNQMIRFVQQTYGGPQEGAQPKRLLSEELKLAKALTAAQGGKKRTFQTSGSSLAIPVTIGITGPGGAGKTTLIDELTLRFLGARPNGRLTILSHDPSAVGKCALLGDRATMVYAQNDRVFIRSMATQGHGGGLAASSRSCLEILKCQGFDLIFVESAGIGQEDLPFTRGLVDRQILVMSPDYGSRLQLQKISMLETADLVVVNKADLPGARTALAELEQRLEMNNRGQKVIGTVAKRHRDAGVDQLFREML